MRGVPAHRYRRPKKKKDTSQSGNDGKYETINWLAAGARGEVGNFVFNSPRYVYSIVTTHSYLPTPALPTAGILTAGCWTSCGWKDGVKRSNDLVEKNRHSRPREVNGEMKSVERGKEVWHGREKNCF